MYSGITSGRVLDGELLYTKILEVNLFAFAYRLFFCLFVFLSFIYFTSFGEKDKADMNSLRWPAPVGLEPAYTRM